MTITVSVWAVVVLALVFANFPFFSQQLFGVVKLRSSKSFGLRLIELVVCYFIVGGIALALEQRIGQIAPQTWEFYVITSTLFLVFAFPGFVCRYLIKSMKVLDLQCASLHVFEGWFSAEADYLAQQSAGQVACPVCGNSNISKRLSAPHLNLASSRSARGEVSELAEASAVTAPLTDVQQLTSAWIQMARHVVANTTDVGDHFAEEARKMHYGEVQERAIRGKATMTEAHALLEEGIAVLPLTLPESCKEPLH